MKLTIKQLNDVGVFYSARKDIFFLGDGIVTWKNRPTISQVLHSLYRKGFEDGRRRALQDVGSWIEELRGE